MHIDFISYNLAFLCEGFLYIKIILLLLCFQAGYFLFHCLPQLPQLEPLVQCGKKVMKVTSCLISDFRGENLLSLTIKYDVTVVFHYGSFMDTLYQVTKVHFYSHFFSESHSVMSNSLRPHGLYSPWNLPGHNTRVDSLSPLQGIFPTQGLNPGLPHCRQILHQLSHMGSPRILQWVAYPVSSRSSQPRNFVKCFYHKGIGFCQMFFLYLLG